MKRPRRSKSSEPPKKSVDRTGMIRVDGEVKAYIVKRAKWGESINLTLRRMFGMTVSGETNVKATS